MFGGIEGGATVGAVGGLWRGALHASRGGLVAGCCGATSGVAIGRPVGDEPAARPEPGLLQAVGERPGDGGGRAPVVLVASSLPIGRGVGEVALTFSAKGLPVSAAPPRLMCNR